MLKCEDLSHIESIHLKELFGCLNHNKDGECTNAQCFYHYKGSLTTPPCTDIVNWFVYKDVLPISKTHLESLKSQWHCNLGHHNFRECQPLCGRRVVKNFK